MGCINLGQVDHLMITISVVFLAVSIKLTQQSNSHLFDQQSEAPSPSFDSSPDELPVFVDATTSGEEDDEGRRVLSIGIPEERARISSGIVQPTISLAEEDLSGSLNELNWSRNADEVINRERMKFSSKPKRNGCSGPSIRARGLIGTTIKRSHFATSRAEVSKRMEEENKLKRNAGGSTRDHHSFSCDTSYEWRDLGSNHYPQFVKTAVCRSSTCVNGIYECRPKEYNLKVLKRVSISDSVCEETQDQSLPESLNLDWRLATVKITHCCDCTSRLATFQI